MPGCPSLLTRPHQLAGTSCSANAGDDSHSHSTAALKVNGGAAGQPPSIFSEACKLHEVIDSNTLFSAEIGDTKLYAALVDWFVNGTRYTVRTTCCCCSHYVCASLQSAGLGTMMDVACWTPCNRSW
jgi:hypothetical protein